MTDTAPRPKRRMKQPTKGTLRARLATAETRADCAVSYLKTIAPMLRTQAELIDGLRAARQHDHDIARRVPRWVRRIFRA